MDELIRLPMLVVVKQGALPKSRGHLVKGQEALGYSVPTL